MHHLTVILRLAQTKGRQLMKTMDEWKFKHLGMRSFTIECHYREDGKIVWATYVQEYVLLLVDLLRFTTGMIPMPCLNVTALNSQNLSSLIPVPLRNSARPSSSMRHMYMRWKLVKETQTRTKNLNSRKGIFHETPMESPFCPLLF